MNTRHPSATVPANCYFNAKAAPIRHIVLGDRTGFNLDPIPARLFCRRQRAGEPTAYACQAPCDIGRPPNAFLDVVDRVRPAPKNAAATPARDKTYLS